MLSSLFYPKTSPLHNNSLIGCKLEHPMYCVPLNMVLQMTSVERHEVLHARGVLVEHDLSNSEPVIFISHQWVSLNHPDPDAAQFTVLQRAILRLLEGYEVRSDWLHSAVDGKDEVDSSWPSLLKNSSLWYDYFSVPQDANRAEDRQRAIRCIPAYIEMATVMFILAPTVNATDSRESQLEIGVYDFSTWQQSGWCRLELLVSHLKPQSRTPVVIRSGKFMHFLATSLWVLTLRVAEGKFSCCTTNHWVVHPDGTASQKECDKVALHGVLKALLRRRLAYERGKSNLRAERQLLAQYHIWLRGLLNVEDTYNIHDSTLDAFLTNYKFATPFEVDEGWTPLRFACISGNVNVARQLLDKKVDVEATLTKAGGKDLFAEKWNTILVQIIAMCCCQEHEDILDLLVAHNANLQPPKHVDAFTAASSCPSPSKRGAFWFLRTFPDWDVNTESSSSEGYLTRRPLCCAVAFNTGIEYAQNLCERKADVTLQAYPVQVSVFSFACSVCPTSSPIMAEYILQQVRQKLKSKEVTTRSSVKDTSVQEGVVQEVNRRILAPRWARVVLKAMWVMRVEPRSFIKEILFWIGSTPLLCAAYEGKHHICQWLLDQYADASIANANGDTALSIAQDRGYTYVVDVLLRHRAKASK